MNFLAIGPVCKRNGQLQIRDYQGWQLSKVSSKNIPIPLVQLLMLTA
jgi:hypothetical protein